MSFRKNYHINAFIIKTNQFNAVVIYNTVVNNFQTSTEQKLYALMYNTKQYKYGLLD